MAKTVQWLLFTAIFNGILTISALFGSGIAPVRPTQAEQPALTHVVYLPLILKSKLKTLVLGYYTGEQKSYDAVQAFSGYLKIVSADIYTMQLDGSIAGGDNFGVAAYDRSQGIQTYACVNNYNNDPAVNDFDPALAHAAIVTHKEAVISRLVAIAQDGKYDGVNIDFENLAYSQDIAADRAAFSLFIHDLAARLHANNLSLAISVPGKTADSAGDTWGYPFDLAALGQDADYLQLMTYDQHGPWSEPGPIAGADWVENVVVYTVSQVNPSRLLIGLPAYGYDWDLTASDPANGVYSATEFPWTAIPTLLAKPGAVPHWDAGAHSPSVTYTQAGHNHEAWYENADSLQAKTKLISQYHLAGLSMWSLGQEDQSFWQAATAGLP